jgi:hypothetical protein
MYATTTTLTIPNELTREEEKVSNTTSCGKGRVGLTASGTARSAEHDNDDAPGRSQCAKVFLRPRGKTRGQWLSRITRYRVTENRGMPGIPGYKEVDHDTHY